MIAPRGFPDTRLSLLRDLKAGGIGADANWRDFFDLYAPAIYRVARLRHLDKNDAEDIVQQAMLAVFVHIEGFEYRRDRGRFRQWVQRIAENKIKDLHRARGRSPVEAARSDAHVERAPKADEEDVWEKEWRRQDLRYCLELVEADISPRRMEAFRLYVVRGVSAEETAKRLGMTVGHVYVVRNLVLSLMRRRLKDLRDASEPARDDADSAGDRRL